MKNTANLKDAVRIKEATRKNFSFGWFKFASDEVDKNWHKDSFIYIDMIPAQIMSGSHKLGLDVGCGSGSDMVNISKKFGCSVVGLDLADSLSVTRKNLVAYNRLYLAQADVYRIPFKNEVFDFAYSFGVLHHLPFPEEAFQAIIEKVKVGGFIAIYVYEDFSQRCRIEQVMLKLANLLRIFTTRLPPYLLYIFCIILAPVVLLLCSLPYRLLKQIWFTKNFAEKIPFRHTVRLDCLRADLYDRLSAPIEKRYSRQQISEWLEKADLSQAGLVYCRGWVAWGKRTK